MSAAKGGNQTQEHGKQGVGGQHFMRREAADKPGPGETYR